MPRSQITYTDEYGREQSLNPGRRGAIFVVVFLLLAVVMGGVGGVGSLLLLTSKNKNFLGLGEKGLNINTTKTEKLVLEESSAITDTVKKISPAVVSITTTQNIENLFGFVSQAKGGGTGFIITNDGLIATNKHVVEGTDTVTVFTSDGKNYQGQVLAKDPLNDLAILKIKASSLPVVELGDSSDLKVGQWIIAIGNALGEFDNTVTVGVISARERHITAVGGQSGGENLEGLLQTDAAINLGNSGGPLVNLKGQVVGMNVAVAGGDAQNIGFAIPINAAKTAIESVKKTGKITRPFLGVRYLPITKELAEKAQLPVDHGALVYRGEGVGEVAVIPGSPADKVGIRENDIITHINGERIDENHSLGRLLGEFLPGQEIELTLQRQGKEQKVKVMLGETK